LHEHYKVLDCEEKHVTKCTIIQAQFEVEKHEKSNGPDISSIETYSASSFVVKVALIDVGVMPEVLASSAA
jgi:hypothetical protein